MTQGSPVIDLSLCLYSGGCEETFNNLDEYLEIYHTSLSSTLNEFGLDSGNCYPFETLKEDWKRYCKHGFVSSLFIWIMKFIDFKEILKSLNTNYEEIGFKVPEIIVEDYKKIVRELVLHMYNNDFF